MTSPPDATEAWEPAYGFCATRDRDPRELAAALELIRRRVCAYGPNAKTCDCKYGLGLRLLDGDASTYSGLSSEQTGCPELRELIHKLLHRGTPGELPTDTQSRLLADLETARSRMARAALVLTGGAA
jgi:hypothetical protein